MKSIERSFFKILVYLLLPTAYIFFKIKGHPEYLGDFKKDLYDAIDWHYDSEEELKE